MEVNQSVQLCSDRDATSAMSLGAQVKYSNTSHTHDDDFSFLVWNRFYRQRNDFSFLSK